MNTFQVVFSDEAAFDITMPRSRYSRRERGSKMTSAHIAQHRPFLRRIMVWACFCHAGPGPIVVIKGTMTGLKYIDTLSNYLVPKMEIWFPDNSGAFQQDNAPCHKAKRVLDFMEENGIHRMDWPPYSPDLSPIENLWAIVKQKVHTVATHTANQLTTRIENIWSDDEAVKRDCDSLIGGMARRIQACIEAAGGPIKY